MSSAQLPSLAPAPQQMIPNPASAAAMQAAAASTQQPGSQQPGPAVMSPGGQPMQPQMTAAPGQFIMAPQMAQGQTAQYATMPQIATYNQQGQLVLQPAGSYAFQVNKTGCNFLRFIHKQLF